MEISCKCPMCGRNNVVTVTKKGYGLWRSGCNIQDAFPNLTPDERELLQTGICPACWDRLFGEEE